MKPSFKITRKINELLLQNDDSDYHNDILLNLILTFAVIILGICGIIFLMIPYLVLLLVDYIYTKFIKSKINNKSKTKVIKIINSYYDFLIPKNKYYYLKGYHNHDNSLEIFIYRFIHVYKDMYNTLEVGTDDFICGQNKRRSAHDIYLICKNYYPDTTINDVLKILVNLRNINKIKGSYCNTIHKYVYHMDSNHRDDNDNTEYGKGIKFKDLINAYKE